MKTNYTTATINSKETGEPVYYMSYHSHTFIAGGVDINATRAWFRHVSINTNNIYAEVDIEMKAKALVCCEIIGETKLIHWLDN